MDASFVKEMAAATARIVKDHMKGLSARVKQIEDQGKAINGNFADVDRRLAAIEDMLTDPANSR